MERFASIRSQLVGGLGFDTIGDVGTVFLHTCLLITSGVGYNHRVGAQFAIQ